ncbi:MAG: patatin family protein [Oscillospiraceae bacterium]|jgi:predicted patatin/cPLA2 family phospholipase|nr:patatin family protein [Oscillospiraceae bacterium]
MEQKKTGLVMEGGAMRGMFTCGVTDVLMEHGVRFDGAIGVSAGAVFGCNYKSHQPGRALRYNKRFCGDPRYGSFHALLRTGDLYDAQLCYKEIPERLDPFDVEAYRSDPMEFCVVCTDVETGRPVYHRCMEGTGEDVLWMRASASMPLVSNVVEVGGRRLLDGGISDAIPVRYFQRQGYNRCVVILTQPLDYRKEKNKLLPVARAVLREYPRMVSAMAGRHFRYNAATRYVREEELAGRLFVIRPPEPLRVGSVEKDPEQLDRVYQIGRTAALECLPRVLAYLEAQ